MIEKETGTVEGVVWIGIGFIICILSLQFDLGSFHAPGPGFVAVLSGLFVSAIGLAMIIARAASKRGPSDTSKQEHPFRIGSWRRLVYTMALLLAYIILFEPVGFVITTFLLMFGLFFDFEKRNYAWSLFFSVVTAAISYLSFEVWLRCQLPRGIFPWW
jgi:putative tricarboxylic transport membrane protein